MFSSRRPNGRLTPTRKLVKKGSSLRDLRPLTERVVLEKVLGVTLKGNSGLACNPGTGEIAFPAGCVIVITSSIGHGQRHIINTSRKTISSLAFSPDGKYLVSGESGHEPAVRVWDVEDRTHPQVSEMPKGHKHGIQCVAFSPNMKYAVSVGFQHDMLVNIWNWREGTAIACNKVSSKVYAISFSENGDYFVTVGVRLVKFWYIDSTDCANKVKKKIPLHGRPAVLGENRNNQFIDVACGLGPNSKHTYSVTKSGLLFAFNEKRSLKKWIDLRVNGAFSLAVKEDFIFCGCSDGIIRVFSSSLQFIGSLPKPHCLGVDVAAGHDASHLLTKVDNANYPDTIAITLDHYGTRLTCIYNDHSIYIWDINDVKKIGKISSFLYHSSCVWDIEAFPDIPGKIPFGSFLTCSSDGTVRVWNIETGSKMTPYRNIYSKELLQVLYTEKDLTNLKDMKCHKEKGRKEPESKLGLRCIKLSPDGSQLASGDKMGNIRTFEIPLMQEILKIEAHESEVLCIEYSSPDAEFSLLASAGRDRLIHVFDCEDNFNLLQTIDDHSASITSIRFNMNDKTLQLISCAADKSVIFRTAVKEPEFQFTRYTNVATKTTFYDMDIHPLRECAVTAGQDRNMRVYDIASGKQLRSFKAAMGDDGVIFKVLLDRSGFYAATSCSDKSLALYDFDVGECVAGMIGHSEIVTGFQFSLDCQRLITVSADSCIFVWRLPSVFSQNMIDKLQDIPNRTTAIDVLDANEEEFQPASHEMFTSNEPNTVLGGYRLSVIHRLPNWAKKQVMANADDLEVSIITESAKETTVSTAKSKPEGRWAERFNPMQFFPDNVDDGEHSVDGTLESKPFHNLATIPLEKRLSNGSMNDEPNFSGNAELTLQKYEKEIHHAAVTKFQSNVTMSRGSDVNVTFLKSNEEGDLVNTESDDVEDGIIYYPNEDELDGDVSRPYDVKVYEDCSDEKGSNEGSSPRDEMDDPTGDSISDDEDLLTAEIAPKWEEFSDMPSRSLEQVETREEFYNENFENLNMTPTEIKEELIFQDATKALPDQPLPFDRNNFHRTSISARFIQRSKLRSSRSVSNVDKAEGLGKKDEGLGKKDEGLANKSINEVNKLDQELESTKRRLEELGFKSLDNWTKRHTPATKNEKPCSSDQKNTENSINREKEEKITDNVTKPVFKISSEISQQNNEPTLWRRRSNIEGEGLSLNTGKVQGMKNATSTKEPSPKKASELIAFFDTSDKASKTSIKVEKVQTRIKQDDKKLKSKEEKGKNAVNRTKEEEKKHKSQNRRSFPFNIAKLTSKKTNERRRSVPKDNLSKTKSCGDLLAEQKIEALDEQTKYRNAKSQQKYDSTQAIGEKDITESNLSELSAELSAALATPPPKLVKLSMSRNYIMGNDDTSEEYRRTHGNNDEDESIEVTTKECQEIVVDLVRTFQRALECHSKILNGDIKDDQRQGLSMLAATFTTISESIADCKSEREKRLLRSPRTTKNAEITPEGNSKTRDAETQCSQLLETIDKTQQTEHILSTRENEQIAPLLEKYSELLMKKFNERINQT